MAVKKTSGAANGVNRLKKSLKSGEFDGLYVFAGEETYLKEYYLAKLKKAVVDETFCEFNLIELEGKKLTPESFNDAIENYPMMAERKLIVVTDFDLYNAPKSFQPVIDTLLNDLPEYVIVVFYYDILEYKEDKRTKLCSKLNERACIADFRHLDERELIVKLQAMFRKHGKRIEAQACSYMVFLCGNSLTNLRQEVEKAAAFSTVEEVTRYHIDSVCTRTIDAVMFDLTDALSARSFDRAIALTDDLLKQGNKEVTVFSSVCRHIQRLYAAKLDEEEGGRQLLSLLGTKSDFFADKMRKASQKTSLEWLRHAARVCAETDTLLKSSAADKQKLLELAILNMAGGKR